MADAGAMRSRAGSAVTVDSGDFPAILEAALDTIGYADFPVRQAHARARGRYLGLGIGNGVKGTGRGPFESGIVRIGRSGQVSVYTGALPIGQAIKTALPHISPQHLVLLP